MLKTTRLLSVKEQCSFKFKEFIFKFRKIIHFWKAGDPSSTPFFGWRASAFLSSFYASFRPHSIFNSCLKLIPVWPCQGTPRRIRVINTLWRPLLIALSFLPSFWTSYRDEIELMCSTLSWVRNDSWGLECLHFLFEATSNLDPPLPLLVSKTILEEIFSLVVSLLLPISESFGLFSLKSSY